MRVAVNGFGRIGRDVVRILTQNDIKELDLVAVNFSGDLSLNAHLFKHDSIYGKFNGEVTAKEKSLVINGKEIVIPSNRAPEQLPWKDLEIDLVIDSTGAFKDVEGLSKHLNAGAKKVLLTAPAKGDIKTIVMGVNEEIYNAEEDDIISNASCTTNCLAPVTKVINDEFKIVKGLMTTIHAYTKDQNLHDSKHKDLRRARAAGINIIPTTTGAAKAVALVIPELKGKLTGYAVRVPVPTSSLIDVVFELENEISVEEINKALINASKGKMEGILGVSDEPLVSSDYIGENLSSVVDLSLTQSISNMVKIVAWYDNEWGYSNRVVDLAKYIASK